MTIRKRNKGYQIDISYNSKRYRCQIDGSKEDALIIEQQCLSSLQIGKSWSNILNKLDLSVQDITLSGILSKIKSTYTDLKEFKKAARVVDLLGPDLKVTDLDQEHIDDLLEHERSRGNSNATCNRKLAVTSKLLTYAHKRGYIKSKPDIEWLKEGAGRVRWFTQDEQDLFCSYLKSGGHHDLIDMVTVACDTGLRKSELKRINVKTDLVGDLLTCEATKNETIRSIPLTKRSKAILMRRGDRPFVHMSDELMRSAWDFGRLKMGLENDKQFTFHMTRHTCASRLVQRGIQIQVVQAWLGHKTIKMTLRYAHLNPDNFLEARKVLDQITGDKTGDNKVTRI